MDLKEIIMNTHSWEDLAENLGRQGLHIAAKILLCVVIYIVGRKLIKYLHKIIDKVMTGKEFDPSVASFIRSLINIVLTAGLLIIIINTLGVATTSFVALLASIGVALGMALSGTVQNFAGGVMILLFRPYKIGDTIDAQGQSGTVTDIQIFNTVILTSDNKTVYIPNGGLSNNVIVNYNNQDNRRIEWVLNVAYGTDYDQAKSIIQEIISADKRIVSDPVPTIDMKTLGESSIDIQVRAWVARGDYWATYYAVNEAVYKVFTSKGIDIPFPQLTVHLDNAKV
jgi:small conductance mechanosensitive channel